MRHNQTYRIMTIAIIALLVSVGSLCASSATVQVSATVLPWVKMNVLQHEINYSISADDLSRDYIDIPFSATMNVDTNVSVLILTLHPAGSDQIVAGISGSNRFDSTMEITLTENERHARHITRDLDFRVLLDKESQIGTHVLEPWISMQAY